jgi:2'-5' RNA ligase
MRLFVAIELDDTARRLVADEQRRLRSTMGDAADLRWTDPGQIHLTLAFLGEVGERLAGGVVQAMTEPIVFTPFQLLFRGLGVFPPHGAPRVLWLGAGTRGDHAARLHTLVAERLRRCDITLEDRPFHPHLTLARWRGRSHNRGGSSKTETDVRALAFRSTDDVARLDVHEVALFQSRQSSQGSTYTALARARLSGTLPPLQ